MRRDAIFAGVVLLASFSAGCVVGPMGGFRSPEPTGPGAVSGGVAATLQGHTLGSDEAFLAGEAQVFLDIGLNETVDVRMRLTGLHAGDTEWNQGTSTALGPGLELKFSFDSGRSALIAGLDYMYYFETYDGDEEDAVWDIDFSGHSSVSPFVGGVFAWGDPASTRVLLSPMLVTYVMYGPVVEGKLSLGLDVPLRERASLRPELIGSCKFSFADGGKAFCSAGIGTAVVF